MNRSEPNHEPPREELRDELARLILGTDAGLTGEEVAAKGGLSRERGERLWRALGFPDLGDSPAYSEADVEAISIVAAAFDRGLLDEETVFRMTRALGQTMSRLADWQVATLVEQVETHVGEGKAPSRLEAAVELAQRAGPGFERLMIYAWRRHLAAAAARMEALGAADAELLSTTMTVGFADMSRFTALSNELDDDKLGALVETFENECTDVVTEHGGRVIKALGDATLFVNADARSATITALDLITSVGSHGELPAIRVGLATGSVLSRLGDIFGPPVNLAARLSHVARSNRVIVDHPTADALDAAEFDCRRMPARHIRGFGELAPITVSRRRGFRSPKAKP
ncbi:adenylate/guanylate cyclase domain-containing protein [Aeromicrobium sp.]|uniref:adenylate/guanylate cyclase domain-containing protein n=1 Tax=Aeromicrobium sp. TaxID=1871063 RepID=UPI003D6B294F